MLNENAQKWVEALRSGKYQQVRGQLTQVRGTAIMGHCCLGVACELAVEAGIIPPGNISKDEITYEGGGGTLPSVVGGTLPSIVKKWLGLATCRGDFLPEGAKEPTALTSLNDNERLNFSQIADVIESEPEGLFRG